MLVGASTFNLLWTTTRFRAENPKLYRAIMAALDVATIFIKNDKQEAARLYLRVSKEPSSVEEVLALLSDIYIQFTLAPKNTFSYSKFMFKIGAIRNQPEDWRDLFFSDPRLAVGS